MVFLMIVKGLERSGFLLDFHEFILAIYPFVLLSLGFILLYLTRCRECEAEEREESFHERWIEYQPSSILSSSCCSLYPSSGRLQCISDSFPLLTLSSSTGNPLSTAVSIHPLLRTDRQPDPHPKVESARERSSALNFQIHSFTMFFIGMIFYFIFN